MKFTKTDWIFSIILGILGILSIYFFFEPSAGSFLSFSSWTIDQINFGTTLLIVFIVCLIGNLLPIPTPYTFIIIPATLTFPSYFWLIGLIASFGALLGEIVGFGVGRGTIEILKNREINIEKIEKWKQLANERPRFVMFLIYLFGLTPLNDDNIMVPLGLAEFDFKKTVFSCFLGKLSMMMLFAAGTVIGMEFVFGQMGYSDIEIIMILLNLGMFIGINLSELLQSVSILEIIGFPWSKLSVYFPSAGQGNWFEGMIVFVVVIIIVWAMMK
ncbi:MAG: VTT domain-containing protein, partial [Candidatus Helarchaeota archaeon]